MPPLILLFLALLVNALVQEDAFIEFIAPEAEGTRGEGG